MTTAVAATATPPHARTSASDAASPIPVVRIFRIQKDAVTTGTLLAAEWCAGISVVRACGDESGMSTETFSRADGGELAEPTMIDGSEPSTWCGSETGKSRSSGRGDCARHRDEQQHPSGRRAWWADPGSRRGRRCAVDRRLR